MAFRGLGWAFMGSAIQKIDTENSRMEKVISAALLFGALLSQSAQADTFKCTFNEPNITTSYDTADQKLLIFDYESGTPRKPKIRIIKGVKFVVKGSGKFELVGTNKKVIQRITLTNAGSDGASEYVYPYEVDWSETTVRTGCESDQLKAREIK